MTLTMPHLNALATHMAALSIDEGPSSSESFIGAALPSPVQAVCRHQHFHDGGEDPTGAFWNTEDAQLIRGEMFVAHLAAASLIPDAQGMAALRVKLLQQGQDYSNRAESLSATQAEMLGVGKRLLNALVLAMDRQPDVPARHAAADLVDKWLFSRDGAALSPVTRVGRALDAVQALHYPDSGRLRMLQASRGLQDWVAATIREEEHVARSDAAPALLEYFGLLERDLVPNTEFNVKALDAAAINAAGKVCMEAWGRTPEPSARPR